MNRRQEQGIRKIGEREDFNKRGKLVKNYSGGSIHEHIWSDNREPEKSARKRERH